MDAVIPAAGRGSRLGELTADRPKGLIDVAGQPLLALVSETPSRQQTS
jgi:glucose-1-phosphate thymidylyltransferase